MLAIDSLVLDLIFEANAELEPETLLDALGGEEVVQNRKIVDPDMQDPRFEFELSPSMPFRRRTERRLMVIDDSVAPMRQDPRAEPVIGLDLRAEKERLIAACQALPVRLGRLFALGSWGDAVLVAKDARDLRGISLIGWALDPTIDVSGQRRANRLTQAEFEEKLASFDKRLEELSEKDILANLGPANFERRGSHLVVDVLDNDGSWDLRKSLAMEASLAAIEKFSILPGAPAGDAPAQAEPAEPAVAEPAATEPPSSGLPSLDAADVSGQVILIFPRERFDLDIAAAIGKRDWDSVLKPQDRLAGDQRDRVFRNGAGFVAPLEFLSEVFIDGKPLNRKSFDELATPVNDKARSLEVHFPRLGPVLLLDVGERGRFITSERQSAEAVLALL